VAAVSPLSRRSRPLPNSGQFIHQYVPGADEFGTIAPGKSADLVMLGANPLLDVRNMRQPMGVMVRGRWFESRELQNLIEEPVPGYKTSHGLGKGVPAHAARTRATEAIVDSKAIPILCDKLRKACECAWISDDQCTRSWKTPSHCLSSTRNGIPTPDA